MLATGSPGYSRLKMSNVAALLRVASGESPRLRARGHDVCSIRHPKRRGFPRLSSAVGQSDVGPRMDHYFPDVPGLGNVAVSSTRRPVWSKTGFQSTTSERRYSTAAPPPTGRTFSGEKRMASGWSFFDNQRRSRARCWQRPSIVCDQPLALRSDPQDLSSYRNFAFCH